LSKPARRRERTFEELTGQPAPANEATDEFASIVADHNKHFAVVTYRGKTRVLWEQGDTFDLMDVRDFHLMRAPDKIWIKDARGRDVAKPTSPIWFAHVDRRFYSDIVMDPRDDAPESAYNLWRGFSVRPSSRGSCALFLKHIRENVCAGDKALARWVEGWMAHMIQRPWEKPGTALVLKGAPGVGKSVVGEILGALIAQHYVTVADPSHFVGRFNAHLAHALFVHVEEGFWAGDKTAEGVLKHRITAPTIEIEKKGHDVITLDSFHRYFIASNERWTVPARHDDRRYAIFEVADHGQKQSEEYFGAMLDEMKRGGYGALMAHLQAFDLSRINVRQPPDTAARAAEKITGLKGAQAWWHEVLSEGDVPTRVRCDLLRREYEEWLGRKRYHGDAPTAEQFGRDLREMCPSIERVRKRTEADLKWFYHIPERRVCRDEFANWLGSTVEWSA
jgi:hypothetical protein